MNEPKMLMGAEFVAEVLKASGHNIDASVASPGDIDAALQAAGVPPVHLHKEDAISYEDFAKVSLQFGTVTAAERIPKSDKLLRLTVDLGESSPRTIVAGIGKSFSDLTRLVGQQHLFVTNLAPRKVMGVESHGMILACGESAESLQLARPTALVPPGSKVR